MQERIEELIGRWLPKSLSKDYWIWDRNSKKLAAEIVKLIEDESGGHR